MSFGASPVDANTIPIGSTYAPQASSGGLPAVLRGGNKQTDGGSNVSEAGAFTLEDGWKPTYSVTYSALAGVAGDNAVLTGSATKTIKLVRVEITGIATTAATFIAQLIKRSAADTGGTTVAGTIVPHDANNPLVTATTTAYSVAPTPGTSLGALKTDKLFLPLTATLSEKLVWDYSVGTQQQPTLRGTAQQLAANLNAAPTGGSLEITFTWTEDSYS